MLNEGKYCSLLQYAIKHIPYYKDYPPNSVITDLPVIRKSCIERERSRFIDQNIITKEASEQLRKEAYCNYGEAMCNPNGLTIYCEHTSGSTGEPFTVYKSLRERIVLSKSLWDMRRKYCPGVAPHRVFYSIHLFGVVENNRILQHVRDSSPQEIYIALSDPRIIMWHTNSRFVKSYIEYLDKFDLQHPSNIICIEITGIYVSKAEKEYIEKRLNVIVLNYYATIENWLIGYETENGLFKINQECVYVELINEKEETINEYGVVGRIAVTSYHLRVMPFIRYLTGDYGMFVMNAYGERELKMIEGRDEDRIIGYRNKYGNTVFRDVIRSLTYSARQEYEFGRIEVKQIQAKSFRVNVVNLCGNKMSFEKQFFAKTCKYLSDDIEVFFEYTNHDNDCNKHNYKGNIFTQACKESVEQ